MNQNPSIGVWDADEPKQKKNPYPLGRYNNKIINIVACSWIHDWADICSLDEEGLIIRVKLSEIKNSFL